MKTRNISFKSKVAVLKSTHTTESFLQSAFQDNISVARSVLNTNYLTGIWKGILPPTDFGVMTVLDAYYCYMAADSLDIALKRTDKEKHHDLYELIESIHQGYVEYNQYFLTTWRVKSASGIEPNAVIKNYSDYERKIAQTEDPIYALVAMLPCFYLWYWFSGQMLSHGVAENNPYLDWIQSCYDDSSAQQVDKFISTWKAGGNTFDDTKAKQIFANSMQHELQVFSALYHPAEDMVVDLLVIQGDSESIASPEGYIKIPQDTNEGAGGKYSYICYKKGPIQESITDIYLAVGSSPSVYVPDGYTKIDKDLNKGAGGKYIYLCYRRVDNTPIMDIILIKGTNPNIAPPAGYERLAHDLNQGAGGKYIYVCIKR